MSHFEALYRHPPTTTIEHVINNLKLLETRDYLATSDEVICILKNHLKQARNCLKQQVDSKRTDREFEVGDWVFVHLQPYKQTSPKKFQKIINLHPSSMAHIKFKSEWGKWPIL